MNTPGRTRVQPATSGDLRSARRLGIPAIALAAVVAGSLLLTGCSTAAPGVGVRGEAVASASVPGRPTEQNGTGSNGTDSDGEPNGNGANSNGTVDNGGQGNGGQGNGGQGNGGEADNGEGANGAGANGQNGQNGQNGNAGSNGQNSNTNNGNTNNANGAGTNGTTNNGINTQPDDQISAMQADTTSMTMTQVATAWVLAFDEGDAKTLVAVSCRADIIAYQKQGATPSNYNGGIILDVGEVTPNGTHGWVTVKRGGRSSQGVITTSTALMVQQKGWKFCFTSGDPNNA